MKKNQTSISTLPLMKDRTITTNSFSKTYAMTGWRIGCIVASEIIVSQTLKVLQYSATSISAYSQRAAVVALT